MRTRRRQEREGADRRHGTVATDQKASTAGATTLRRRTGNAGMQALIGRMGDAHEQEADRVANAVMRSPSAVPNVQRMCAEYDDGVLLVQRQPSPNATPPVDTPPDPVDDLIDAIGAAIETPLSEIPLTSPVNPKLTLTPELVLKQQWPAIRKWIIALGTKGAPRVPSGFTALDTPGITDPLRALPKADRIRVADGVLDRLILGVGTEAPKTYRDEFNRLTTKAKGAMEPSADPLVGYVAMREGLKATFGSIDAMNAYFSTLEPAEFPPQSGTVKVFGRQSLVHPELKKALKKATDWLQSDKVPPGTFDRVIASMADIATLAGKVHHRGSWAISIRENRNNPTEIGNHSFGFALDIDSNANPNLPKFRWDIVKQLTDFNVYGADIAGAKAGQPYATALQSAKHFREASDKFRGMFDSQPHFEAALAAEAAKHQIPFAPAELFKVVAAASQRGKPGAEAMAALQRMLLDALNKEEARTAVRDTRAGGTYSAHEDPLILATLVSALRPKIKSRADLARLMPFILAQVNTPLDKPAFAKLPEIEILFDRKVIAELKRVPEHIRQYEMPNSLRLRLMPSVKDAEVTALAKSLVELHGIFVGTRNKAGQPIGQGTSLPAVAMHGFMNLEPELVAALTSSEGGNLVWLGATYGTKDWMHFQLKSPPKITPQGSTWP